MHKQLIECVPNFSEGRDAAIIEKIIAPFRGTPQVKLLDYQSDADHNRLVVTLLGTPDALGPCVLDAVAAAVSSIDMTTHRGQHPRMGAVDVVPFIPIQNIGMADVVAYATAVAEKMATRFQLPVFLYEAAASRANRRNLADVRRGQFEGLAEKLKQDDWQPDFGPDTIHPTAGASAVGARMPLVAFNVNLNTDDLTIARSIAQKVRHKDGGLRYCKAMGVALEARAQVQVSMNLTDYTQTALYRVRELIRMEAERYGVCVCGSEIVGLVPMAALVDSAAYYLGLEGFTPAQVIESHLIE